MGANQSELKAIKLDPGEFAKPVEDFFSRTLPGQHPIEGYLEQLSQGDTANSKIHSLSPSCLAKIVRGRAAFQDRVGIALYASGAFHFVPSRYLHANFALSDDVQIAVVKIPDDLACQISEVHCRVTMTTLGQALFDEIVSWGLVENFSEEQLRIVSVFADQLRYVKRAATKALVWPHDERLARVGLMIVKEPGTLRSVEDWSTIAGMTQRNFSKLFQQDTGMEFGQWLNLIRVAIAAKRLAAGQTLKSVALDLGFKDSSALSKIFKKHVGIGATEFVRALAHDPQGLTSNQTFQLFDYAEIAQRFLQNND